VTFVDYYGVAGTVSVAAGNGGNGAGAGSKGGSTGGISKVILDGAATSFGIGRLTPIAGITTAINGGSGDLAGGTGGLITGISGTVGRLFITAADGGAATTSTGNGGAGGSVTAVNIGAVSDFVRIIAAGDGGAGGANASGGAGGSISAVNVAGDIGDFSASFDVVSITSGQGGLVAGKGGTGLTLGKAGSITGITADRIATIIAGKTATNALSSINAVSSITLVNAAVIGADLDHDGMFDFVDSIGTTAFDLSPTIGGTSDAPTDGLVLVSATGAISLSVQPLKLVKV
jgi:hypothetical protein